MRKEDIERFRKPYEYDDPDRTDKRFSDALSIKLEATRSLCAEVFGDLDVKTYGITWWKDFRSLGASRRILISDHLYLCVRGIEQNLLEAKLHLLEARDAWEQQSARTVDAVKLTASGKPVFKVPERKSPWDDLPDYLSNIHIAGFQRAVGSAIDCLGASIVGVLGLPTNLLRADLSAVEKVIGDKLKMPKTSGEKFQVAFLEIVKDAEKKAGPDDWLVWATDYRNMVVHRARRTQIFYLEPKPIIGFNRAALTDKKGIPYLRTPAIRKLPQDPALSDTEALLPPTPAFTLSEDADQTLSGILDSTAVFIETIGKSLLDAWKRRRQSPSFIEQPRNQWPKVPSGERHKFAGYTKANKDLDYSQMTTSPEAVKRLQCASLANKDVENWKNFD